MTTSTSNDMQELIGKARRGLQCFGYRFDPLHPIQTTSTPEQHWQSRLANLFAQWQDSSVEIRAVSFVFTDEPYLLSDFVFDAVVVWDGEGFRRIEIGNLPVGFRDALLEFPRYDDLKLLCSVGDTLIKMDEVYSHQLLSGQAYLTMDTLTVLNVWGENSSGVEEFTPALPFTVTALISGSMDEAAARINQDTHQGGILHFLHWTTSDQDQSRVSKAHVQNFIAPPRPLSVPKLDPCDPIFLNSLAIVPSRTIT